MDLDNYMIRYLRKSEIHNSSNSVNWVGNDEMSLAIRESSDHPLQSYVETFWKFHLYQKLLKFECCETHGNGSGMRELWLTINQLTTNQSIIKTKQKLYVLEPAAPPTAGQPVVWSTGKRKRQKNLGTFAEHRQFSRWQKTHFSSEFSMSNSKSIYYYNWCIFFSKYLHE